MKFKYNFMSDKKNKIKPHLSDEEINKKLKETKKDYDIHRRLLLIRMVKNGETINKASENLNVDRKTGERWVKLYNENGYDGLKTKYSNCGRKSELSKDDLELIRKELTREDKSYNIQSAMDYINTTFNTNYTYNGIWEILRVRLKLNYSKPFSTPKGDIKKGKKDLKKT